MWGSPLAVPAVPPIDGLDRLGPGDGVHLPHTMGDTFNLMRSLTLRQADHAVIVGAGCIGIEMAEALTHRGISVTVLERLPQVLPRSLDAELAQLVSDELRRHGVIVDCGTGVRASTPTPPDRPSSPTPAPCTFSSSSWPPG